MKITHEIYHSSESGFINSRTALKILLEKEGEIVPDLQIDLALAQFRDLPRYPKYVTSLTHTKDLGAAVLGKKSELKGIGIDVEWADRPIKPDATKFFVHKKDQHNLDLLTLWTVKEAAFKALSPIGTYPGTLVLSKIIVNDTNFFTEEEPHLVGNFSTYQDRIEDKIFICTIATLSKVLCDV